MAKIDPRLAEIETQEWLESLDDVARNEGAQTVKTPAQAANFRLALCV